MARQTGGKRIRVRSKRLDQLDETKLALALWLMAKDILMAESPESASQPVVTPANQPGQPYVNDQESA
jgi:hypothetical protein